MSSLSASDDSCGALICLQVPCGAAAMTEASGYVVVPEHVGKSQLTNYFKVISHTFGVWWLALFSFESWLSSG